MKVLTFKRLTTFLNYFMIFMMLFALSVMISLPSIAKWYISIDATHYEFTNPMLYYYIIALLYIAGFCSVIILNQLRKMFKTCSLENPFIEGNVRSLRMICYTSGIIALLFLTKVWVMNSFLTMIVVFVFLIATIFSYVLCELFQRAVHYKTENDLTI